MKSIFTIGLFLLLMCGVFGDETDEVKSVSVMEGDSVTLHTNLTQIEGISKIVWRFGDKDPIIAEISKNKPWLQQTDEKFRNRLQLNNQTGSLTIKNMTSNHSGLYNLEINYSNGNKYKNFNVTVDEGTFGVPGLSPGVIAGICFIVLLVSAAPVVFYYRHRICDQNHLMVCAETARTRDL